MTIYTHHVLRNIGLRGTGCYLWRNLGPVQPFIFHGNRPFRRRQLLSDGSHVSCLRVCSLARGMKHGLQGCGTVLHRFHLFFRVPRASQQATKGIYLCVHDDDMPYLCSEDRWPLQVFWFMWFGSSKSFFLVVVNPRCCCCLSYASSKRHAHSVSPTTFLLGRLYQPHACL